MNKQALNILCITSYFKGEEFLRSCKKDGNKVYLLTSSGLKNEPWPWDSIDEVNYVNEEENNSWNMEHVSNWIAFKMRSVKFDRFVSLDDFDVERTANLRELFRMPGMGQTTANFFRDKLAMRVKAKEVEIPIPAFVPCFNDLEITEFLQTVPAPWLIKPRQEASAIGIQKIHSLEEIWRVLHSMGDKRHKYLIEKFAPGDVYHVDSLSFKGNIVFSRVSRYIDTPFEVAHSGGIFRSQTVETGSFDDIQLRELNKQLMQSFGMRYSATHSEFIKSKDTGEFFFLETSCRVGGANIAEMVEAASGINLWAEWAKIEAAVLRNGDYTLPEVRNANAGIVVSLSRYMNPDDSPFNDPEVCWRLKKDWHIGCIVRSEKSERVRELLDKYTLMIQKEYHASLPPQDKAFNA